MPKSRNRKEHKQKANAHKERVFAEKKKYQKDMQRYFQSMKELQEQNTANIVELENVGKNLNLDFNNISSIETPDSTENVELPYAVNIDESLITDAIIVE